MDIAGLCMQACDCAHRTGTERARAHMSSPNKKRPVEHTTRAAIKRKSEGRASEAKRRKLHHESNTCKRTVRFRAERRY